MSSPEPNRDRRKGKHAEANPLHRRQAQHKHASKRKPEQNRGMPVELTPEEEAEAVASHEE